MKGNSENGSLKWYSQVLEGITAWQHVPSVLEMFGSTTVPTAHWLQ